MDSRELALACIEFADNRKAENIVALDVRNLTSVTDYFVLCSGTSEPHLKAIINEIRDAVFKKYHIHPNSMDGMVGTSWVVLDYYDVIIHVMRADTRERYDLESFWGDAKRLSLADKDAPVEEVKPKKVTKKATTAKTATKKTVAKKKAEPKTPKTAAADKPKKTVAKEKPVAKKTTAKKTATTKKPAAKKTVAKKAPAKKASAEK